MISICSNQDVIFKINILNIFILPVNIEFEEFDHTIKYLFYSNANITNFISLL